MAIACGWRLNRAAQARPRPMSASPSDEARPLETAGACPERRQASRHHTGGQTRQRGWQRAIRGTVRCVWVAALAPTVVASLAIQRLAGRSQACVSLGTEAGAGEERAHGDDRGAGGASSRSQRAPAHSRARERCRFKRGCRAERLVVLSQWRSWRRRANTTAKFGRGIKSERCARPGRPWARAGADGMVLRARRGVGGDVTGPWQGRLPARIAQARRVGEFYPKLRFLGVGGQFRDLVRTT